MLEQLLTEIRAGGTLEIGALSKKLGVTPQMIEVLLEHLQRTGHIRPYEETCGDGCGSCSLKSVCDRSRRINLLKLWQG